MAPCLFRALGLGPSNHPLLFAQSEVLLGINLTSDCEQSEVGSAQEGNQFGMHLGELQMLCKGKRSLQKHAEPLPEAEGSFQLKWFADTGLKVMILITAHC